MKQPLRFFFLTMVTAGRRPLFGELAEAMPKPRLRRRGPNSAHAVVPHRPHGVVVPSPLGGDLLAAWATLGERLPGVTPCERCAMPDHFHGVFFINVAVSGAPQNADAIVADLRATLPNGIWATERPHVITPFESRALSCVRHYVRGNPDRALWKQRHPDRFLRVEGVRAPVLPTDWVWTGLGNLMALASPFLMLARISRKLTPAELACEVARHVDLARQGWTLVGGFLSPGERMVMDTMQRESLGPWVRLLPYGIPPRYDPSLAFSREVGEHGALLLSPFPPEVPWGIVKRENCLAMNDAGAAIEALARARRGIAPC